MRTKKEATSRLGIVVMEEDKELEKIKLKKLRETFRNTTQEKELEKTALTKPLDVTDATFSETVQSHPLVVIDCWAAWCAPCHMVAPIVEELTRDYSGKIFFGKLNVDENQTVPIQYQIMSIPTLLVFKNGKLIDRIIGAMSKQMFESRITRHL